MTKFQDHLLALVAVGVLSLSVQTFGIERVAAAIVAYGLLAVFANRAGPVSVPGGVNPDGTPRS